MPIEFRCCRCGKLLREADEQAGQAVRCSDCQELLTVPLPRSASTDEALADARPQRLTQADVDALGISPSTPATGSKPDGPDAFKTCPMCGQQIRATARACRFCGERFHDVEGDGVTFRPTRVSASDVVAVSWEIFKRQGLMLCVGHFLTSTILTVFAVASYFGTVLAAVANVGPGRPPDPDDVAFWMLRLGLPLFAVYVVLHVWLSMGYAKFSLNVARGQDPDVAQVFSGGRYLLRGLGAWIVLAVINGITAMLILIAVAFVIALFLMRQNPLNILTAAVLGYGVIFVAFLLVQMRFQHYAHHIVEQESGALSSLWTSWKITRGNWRTQLVLVPVLTLIALFGGMALFCVGQIVTLPFLTLVHTVAYLMMSGRRVRITD